MPDHPTLCQYYRMVWNKASAIEGRNWVTSTGAAIMLSLIGAGILGTLQGFDVLLNAKRPEWVVAGILMIVGGVGRAFWCLIRSPHQMHCEQLGKYDSFESSAHAKIASLTNDRDRMFAESTCHSLLPVDARRYLELFAKWLNTESQSNPSDVTEHRQRYNDIFNGLLRKLPPAWEKVGFSCVGDDHSSGMLGGRAGTIREQSNHITDESSYNHRWKPPEWLLELDAATNGRP